MQLGPYTPIAEIARGGMGIVYLARNEARKLVVVKLLKPELAADEKYLRMFIEEARLSARLKHRNIVQTEDLGQTKDLYYFVMEYLEGRTLESVLRLRGERALRVPIFLRIACDILAGLHYAHEATDQDAAPLGLVHRDVSPQNVFLTYDGHVKLLDFGVAKAFGRVETDPGVLRGRVTCMAPEHLDDSRDAAVDRRADVFSVGVLLREALTGASLWGDKKEVEILRELMGGRIPPFPEGSVGARIAPEIREIIEKAMSPDREARYRTAHAMRAALEQHVIRIDPAGSLAELGQFVAREFAEHREYAASIISQHVSSSDKVPVSGLDLPILPLSASVLPFGAATQIPGPAIVSSSSIPAFVPPPQFAELVPQPARFEPTSSEALVGTSSSPSSEALVGTPLAPRTTSRVPTIVGMMAIVAATGVGAGVLVHQRQTPNGVQAALAAPVATPNAATSAVMLHVAASPAGAQLQIDDVVTPANPWHTSLARGSTHTVKAVAAGHAPKSEMVTLNTTTHVTIVLDPLDAPPESPPEPSASVRPAAQAAASPPRRWMPGPARRPAAAPQSPSPAAAPAPGAPPSPGAERPADVFTGGRPPSRPIDDKNPYQ